jgi:hypothetical protein
MKYVKSDKNKSSAKIKKFALRSTVMRHWFGAALLLQRAITK